MRNSIEDKNGATLNGSDEHIIDDSGLSNRKSSCSRRLVLLCLFGAVCCYKASDGSRFQIQQSSHKSFKAGNALRASKNKCHNCTLQHQQLPSSNQVWSHATNSVQRLQQALDEPSTTAIEADVLMGHDVNRNSGLDSEELEPVMCHPPLCTSDLSVKRFFQMATAKQGRQHKRMILQHHIKLDFKELKVIAPALQVISSLPIKNPKGKVIFLNADILPQPGARIEAHDFFDTCLQFLNQTGDNELRFAFSLGYNIEDRVLFGFHEVDLTEMAQLVRQYNVTHNSAGVVLAINARLLAKNTLPFDLFLDEFPTVQILAWAGHGEPPVSRRDYDKLIQHFEEEGRSDRIGFDCHVAESRFSGFLYDSFIYIVFMVLVCIKAFQLCCCC